MKSLHQRIYDYIPSSGRYTIDVRVKFGERHHDAEIADAVQQLLNAGHLRLHANTAGPFYVRVTRPKAFYAANPETTDVKPANYPTPDRAEPAPARSGQLSRDGSPLPTGRDGLQELAPA